MDPYNQGSYPQGGYDPNLMQPSFPQQGGYDPYNQPTQQYYPPNQGYQMGGYTDQYQQSYQQGYQPQQSYNYQQPSYPPQGGYDANQMQPSFPQPSYPPQGGFDGNQMQPSYPQQGGYDSYNQPTQQYYPPNQTNYQTEGMPSQQSNTSYDYQQSSFPQQGPKKKALLIGINYYNTQSVLKGCINDVKNIKQFLLDVCGFVDDPHHMRVLTDDSTDPRKTPTRANMLEGMKWLVQGAQPGDSFFFHFSGHGSQQSDTNGDEDDGYDETLCPVDYKTAGMIVDDLMHQILVKPLPQGSRLTFIADCCHSGTALDLPFQFNENGLIPEKQIIKSKMSLADVIGISGCLDSQTSSDCIIDNKATGAMSFAFIKALKENSNLTIGGLLSKMREILRNNKFSQIPQISASHMMNMKNPFTL